MEEISQRQVYRLFSLQAFTTIIAYLLGILLGVSGYNGPLGAVIGTVIGLAITYPAYKLGMRRQQEPFFRYGKQIAGAWLHYPLVAYIVLATIILALINFWELNDFLIQFYLPSTPAWAIVLLCGLCVAYTAHYGIKSIFRAAEGVFFISLISFLLIPVLVSEHLHWYLGQTVITHFNLKEAWPSAYYVAMVFGEMAFIVLVFPYIKEAHKTFKALALAALTAIAVILTHIMPLIMLFGINQAANMEYSELEMLRFMQSGSFLEALDPAFIALWLASVFVKISFLLYVGSLLFSQICGLPSSKPIILPMVAFVCILSLVFVRSSAQFAEFIKEGFQTFVLIAQLIPSLYYLLDVLRFPRLSPARQSVSADHDERGEKI